MALGKAAVREKVRAAEGGGSGASCLLLTSFKQAVHNSVPTACRRVSWLSKLPQAMCVCCQVLRMHTRICSLLGLAASDLDAVVVAGAASARDPAQAVH